MRLVLLTVAAALPALAQFEFFETRIRPVLAAQCYSCHDAKTATSGLKLDSKVGMEQGGSRGPAVLAGNAEASLLYRAISQTGTLKMPPTGKLPDQTIENFREWIRHGAEDPREESAASSPAPQSTIDWSQARQHWKKSWFQDRLPSTMSRSTCQAGSAIHRRWRCR